MKDYELSKKDIDRLPETVKRKLIQIGFKKLNKNVYKTHYHEIHPKQAELWTDVMDLIDN